MKNNIFVQSVIVASVSAMLAGCGTVQEVRTDIQAKLPEARAALEQNITPAQTSRVVERTGQRLSAKEVVFVRTGSSWLRAKTVSLDAPNPLSLTQVIAKLSANGINISSDLPLDGVTYVGTVHQTDAENALRQILGTAGLDYEADDTRRLVTIKPLPVRQWNLQLGNRHSNFSLNGVQGGASTSTTQQNGNNSANGGSTQQSSVSTTTNTSQGNNSVNGSSQGTSSATLSGSTDGDAGLGFATSEDYWGALDRELKKRLTVMVPAPRATSQRASVMQGGLPALPVSAGLPMALNQNQPPIPVGAQSEQQGGGAATEANPLYVSKTIGTYSLNPETGAIVVQAPRWLLEDLDTYFHRTHEMFNTSISFEGMLVLVSNSRSDSEGFEIQQFATWAAGRYGAVLSNNALGGVTMSFGDGKIPTVTAQGQSVGGALLGIRSSKDGLSIFNSYLQERGDSSIVQRPKLATTSGVPGEYSNLRKTFYTVYSQTASAGNTGAAAQASNNTIVPVEFGTQLKIFPRYDVDTGLVRALIRMRSIVPDGQQNLIQVVSAGNTVQQVGTPIPLQRELKTGGEVLLRDGDLIIVGGQSEETLQTNENGLPSANGPIGGLLGTKKGTRAGGTYYFALKVAVDKR